MPIWNFMMKISLFLYQFYHTNKNISKKRRIKLFLLQITSPLIRYINRIEPHNQIKRKIPNFGDHIFIVSIYRYRFSSEWPASTILDVEMWMMIAIKLTASVYKLGHHSCLTENSKWNHLVRSHQPEVLHHLSTKVIAQLIRFSGDALDAMIQKTHPECKFKWKSIEK